MATITPMSGLTSRNPWARLLQGLVSGASLFADGVVSGREAEEKRKAKKLEIRTKEAELEGKQPPQQPEPPRARPAWLGLPWPPLETRLGSPPLPDSTKPKPATPMPGTGETPGGPPVSQGVMPAAYAPETWGVRPVASAPTPRPRVASARNGARRPVTPSRYASLVRNGLSQYAEHVGRAATAEERRDIEALIAQKISAGHFT